MKHLLFVLLIFTLIPCRAGDVVIHLGSYHTAYRSELRGVGALNEFNPGIGWQNAKYSLGIYKNSLSKNVAYGARKWSSGSKFVFAGLANADPTIAPVVPFAGIGVDIGMFQIVAFPSITYLPHIPDKHGKLFAVISLSVKY